MYDRVREPPPRSKGTDRLTIMEDSDGDGRADTFKDFVSDLNLCTGIAFGYRGVFVMQFGSRKERKQYVSRGSRGFTLAVSLLTRM